MARSLGLLMLLACSTMLLAAGAPAFAQQGPGGLISPQRDCQTILRCNFTRTGSYRGCISAYTCRVCRLVRNRCSIGNVSANCRQMRCDWGS